MVLEKAGSVSNGFLSPKGSCFVNIESAKSEDGFSVMRLPSSWLEARELFESKYGVQKWIRGNPELLPSAWFVFVEFCCGHLEPEKEGEQ